MTFLVEAKGARQEGKKKQRREGEERKEQNIKRQEGRLEAGDHSMHGPNIRTESVEFLRGWCHSW